MHLSVSQDNWCRLMFIYEPRNTILVSTPKGKARIWLVTEFGMETQKVFTCILDSGEIWEFTNSQIKVQKNPTVVGFENIL